MAFPPRPRVGPTLPGERFLEIDVLRGFALFGILVVNMDSFAWPLTDSRLTWTSTGGIADRVAGALIRFLAEGKFYTLFSLLFGFGLAMQMKRAEARTAPFVPFFLRRLAVLFGFGLLHGVLLWYGDILMTYAALGVPLLLLRHCRPRTLVVWSAVCLLLTVLFFTGVVGIAGLIGMPQSGQSSGQAADAEERQEIQQDIRVYSQGTFREIMAKRINDLVFISLLGIPTLPTVFAMFLVGLLAGRSGVIEDVPNHRSRLRWIAIWGLGIGIAGNAVYVLAGPQDLPGPLLVSTIGQILGGPALMLFYACGIVLLLQREGWRRRLAVLAPVGRMPLTNYLLQSIVCTTIFYGYGLGLYGKVGLAAGLALSACIFTVQIWLSAWWFRKFSFGPLEWVWRTLTYGGLPAPHG